MSVLYLREQYCMHFYRPLNSNTVHSNKYRVRYKNGKGFISLKNTLDGVCNSSTWETFEVDKRIVVANQWKNNSIEIESFATLVSNIAQVLSEKSKEQIQFIIKDYDIKEVKLWSENLASDTLEDIKYELEKIMLDPTRLTDLNYDFHFYTVCIEMLQNFLISKNNIDVSMTKIKEYENKLDTQSDKNNEVYKDINIIVCNISHFSHIIEKLLNTIYIKDKHSLDFQYIYTNKDFRNQIICNYDNIISYKSLEFNGFKRRLGTGNWQCFSNNIFQLDIKMSQDCEVEISKEQRVQFLALWKKHLESLLRELENIDQSIIEKMNSKDSQQKKAAINHIIKSYYMKILPFGDRIQKLEEYTDNTVHLLTNKIGRKICVVLAWDKKTKRLLLEDNISHL